MTTREIVAKLWNLCNVLMDDGITYHQYVTELTYILFLKMAKETGAESQIDNWYMCYAMQSPYFYTITRGNMKGVGITRITLNMLVSRLIPVPPLQEQKQISVKCRELISLSSNIENDKEFIRQILSETKSKILDLAIRGKLVPQDPNDEPASVLLERIRAEKEELIKQGKCITLENSRLHYEGGCTFTMLQFYLQEPVVHWQFYGDKCGSFQCFHAPSNRQAKQYHYTFQNLNSFVSKE